MKKVLSSIVAALVALSFAGLVCAAEPTPPAAPAAPAAAADVKKEERAAKPAKKKHKKAKKVKKEEVPADAAAPAAK